MSRKESYKYYLTFLAILAFIFIGLNNASAWGGGSEKVTKHYSWTNPITGEKITRSSNQAPVFITFQSGSVQAQTYGTSKKFWEEYYEGKYLWYSPVPPEQLVESNADYDRYIILENKQTVWGSTYNPSWAANWFTNRNFTYNLKKGRYEGKWSQGYKGDNSGTTEITTAYRKNGVTYNYIGKNYEWRYLGYSSDGLIVGNPNFPPEHPRELDWHPDMKLWIWKPWDDTSSNGPAWDEDAKQSKYDIDSRKTQWLADLFFAQNPEFLLTRQGSETDEQRALRSARYWKDAILLKTNPEWSTGITQLYHNGNAPGEDGLWYILFTMKTPEKPNLRITQYQIIDTETNKQVGRVYRNGTYNTNQSVYTVQDEDFFLERGKEYKIVTDVKNMQLSENGKDTAHKPLGVDLHIAYDEQVDLIDEYSESNYAAQEDYNSGTPRNGEEIIKHKEVVVFDKNYEGDTWTFTVPEDPSIVKDKMKIRVEIPIEHYIKGENTIVEDDFAELTFLIEREDIGTLKQANLLENGMIVDEVMPNTTYDLQFFINKPYGKTPVGDPANLGTNPFGSLQVIVRNSEGEKVHNVTTKETLHKGDTVMVEIKGVQSGDLPWIEAEWQIRQIHRDLYQSTILSNDGPFKHRWISEINIAVQNFEIEPQVIHRGQHQPAGAEQIKACYEVMNANPKGESRQIVQVITNLITGQKWTFDDVFVGNHEQVICKDLGLVNLTFGDNKFSVEVNPKDGSGERRWDEFRMNGQNPYEDNIAYQSILVDRNIQEEYCETVHKRNNWNQEYTKSLYYQYYERDPEYDDEGNFTGWSAPYPVDDLVSTTYQTVGHWETYEIEKAQFTSRNHDGDILSGKGKIRAGYGFELEIDVAYKTNVEKDSPKPWNTGRVGYRLDIYPPIYPVYAPESFYIEMPYEDEAGEPVRYKLDIIRKSGSWDEMTYTFALPQRDAFGKEINRRIYFNEDVSNGIYQIRLDTAPFYGYTNKPAVPYLLCDTQYVSIEVLGSNADDVNSHVTQ